MGSRTAISAGVLAVALAAVPVAAPAASAAAQDCTRDGGLLAGVTNTLCDVVGAVTGTVDTLTGGATQPLTDGLDKTTDEVLGRVGQAVPTTRSTPDEPATPTSTPRPRSGRTPDPEGSGQDCLPVLACANQQGVERLTPTPQPSAGQKRRPRQGAATATATASAPAQPRVTRPQSPPPQASARPTPKQETAHAEEPRVDLLWPNPFSHELAVPMQDQRVVRPSPPASDVLGTVLTIALLGSAVLATRIVQQRRHRTEPTESIPFEPARAGSNGRHRLA